ncbi:MAG: alpha/beta hydrolase [Bacteroidales bacterium]|jgi:pimeloyl-ACP methyl ester carboxylesterase|nr:alpha/beta hydrolase [Bacteroidales bacterium]
MKNVTKIILLVLGIILSIFIILIFVIRINSPGRLNPLTDNNGKVIEGSLTEKNGLQIGHIKQGFFIRSENPDNPVILFLHGGPGSPELPMIEVSEKNNRLEKYFTVCYWDQRAAGMTYSKDIDTADITVSQFVEDTREITEYLINRFGKEKIYIMGHSWGSYLGIKVVEKYPEYYHAFIGIGQVTNQHLSEQLAYHYMMEHAKAINDKKVIKALNKYDPNAKDFPTQKYLISTRTSSMNKYGIGITHNNFSMRTFVKDLVKFKGYTLSEKVRYAKGSIFSLKHVFYYVINDNLFESSTLFEVPIYIIHGLYDYQVSYKLAKEWINFIEAPDRELYTFENSAHSPNTEEPEKFVEVVREIFEKNKIE